MSLLSAVAGKNNAHREHSDVFTVGVFPPICHRKGQQKKHLCGSHRCPFIVELLQMVFGRSFDIDDLICNFIGIVVGFFIGFAIKNTKQKSKLNVN